MPALSLVLVLALTTSAGHIRGLPKNSAKAGQVRFRATLLRETVRVGEPLLVTGVIKNPTADTQYVPFDDPHGMSDLGMAQYTLLDSQGTCYWPEIWAAVDGDYRSDCCSPVAPGESVYWHQLLSLDHYYVADRGPRRWFDQTSGGCILVTTMRLPKYAAGNPFSAGGFTLADTLPFSLVMDTALTSRIVPYRRIIGDGLWSLFTPFTPQQMDSVIKAITPRPESFDVGYPYLDYVIPFALNRPKGGSPEAIADARRFIERHQGHPLAEEMTFGMWEFLRRLGLRASQDSLAQVLLKTYPRNTRIRQLRLQPH